MNLKEPKKKKRVRLETQPPLPIITDENGEWRIYTAHLSASGTCIVDPDEMEAVYSMGFFGKGSLSRSFPSFGRRRFGVPPIIRDRQWVRRQKWLEELQALNENSDIAVSEHLEKFSNKSDENSSAKPTDEESCSDNAQASTSKTPAESPESRSDETKKNSEEECQSMIREPSDEKPDAAEPVILSNVAADEKIENEEEIPKPDDSWKTLPCVVVDETAKVNENSKTKVVTVDETSENEKNQINTPGTSKGSMKVDEVILDSTEDEETCEIVERGSIDEKDICFLNNEEFENKSDDNFSYHNTNDEAMEEDTNPYEVLVLPDTDSDSENYLTKVKPKIEKEGFPINETLHLTFEETFFLMYGLGCLQLIHYDGSVFTIRNAWNHFQLQDKHFMQKYVVYHYFRSKGWVVKPGLKFGGDFLLYKQGPPFYHASYIVIIEVVDADSLLRIDGKSTRTVTWKNLIGLERLSETIAKEILFAQVLWPSSVPRNGSQINVDALSDFTVRELLWRRWNPKRKQEFDSMEDEDSESS